MKNLKCFVLGMATTIAIVPIVESLTEIILGKMEISKAKNTKSILKLNKDIEELQIQLGDFHDEGNAIGFQIEEVPDEDEDDEDWDDEEWEDKTVVGFR